MSHAPLLAEERDTSTQEALEPTLVERYSRMAHESEARGIDHVLRGIDIALSLCTLIVTAPLLLLAAVAILVSSGRPLLYGGARVGRAGRVFTMYKLRTLRRDAEARIGSFNASPELEALTAGEVTPLGRVLRATKIDELPQLWNVLRGDMSIVGPRPIRPSFFEELCEEIPQYWQRLVVRPGLTGFAQVRLGRVETWVEKLAHDLEFIADRSVPLYFATIVRTAWDIVFGRR